MVDRTIDGRSPGRARVATALTTAGQSAQYVQLALDISELFPEVGGVPIDLELHAPSVLLRALNDASPELRERVLAYYGPERAHVLAVSRLNRLTNPAYRAYRERLDLPERDAGVTHFQSLWRP